MTDELQNYWRGPFDCLVPNKYNCCIMPNSENLTRSGQQYATKSGWLAKFTIYDAKLKAYIYKGL